MAGAVATAIGSVKMNYELLGNQIAHIHWHLIPAAPTTPRRASRCGRSRTSPAAAARGSARIALIRRTWEPDSR